MTMTLRLREERIKTKPTCPYCGVNLDYEKCHCFDDLEPLPGTDTLVTEGELGASDEHIKRMVAYSEMFHKGEKS